MSDNVIESVPQRYRQRLADNIRDRMSKNPDVDSPEKLARRVFWIEGRRAGRPVSARTIRYILDPRDDAPAPALDLLVSISRALACEPWELLVDTDLDRQAILMRLFGPGGGKPKR